MSLSSAFLLLFFGLSSAADQERSTGTSYLKIGGSLRERYEDFQNKFWGQTAVDTHLLHRLMLNADVRFNKKSKIYFELKSGLVSFNNHPIRPFIDEDKLDINALFYDYSPTPNTILRLGRQELDYGDGRLVAIREGPNVRFAYDGFKLMLSNDQYKCDLFWVMPVPTTPDYFDDHSTTRFQLWSTYCDIPQLNLQSYYFGFYEDSGRWSGLVAKELRHTFGVRLFQTAIGWNYDVEYAYQVGIFAGKTIQAWMGSVNSSYSFEGKWKPRLGLKTWVASGNQDPNGDKLEIFNTLFARGNLIDASQMLGGTNIVNLGPFAEIWLARNLQTQVGYNFFWRHSVHDGIYTPGRAVIRSGSKSTERFIGEGEWFWLLWKIHPNIKLRGTYSFISAGPFIEQTGPAKNVDYYMGSAELAF